VASAPADGQRVELTVTAAFYAMVPRITDALRVPVENRGARPLDGDQAPVTETETQ
jgi:hypothetical protein